MYANKANLRIKIVAIFSLSTGNQHLILSINVVATFGPKQTVSSFSDLLHE